RVSSGNRYSTRNVFNLVAVYFLLFSSEMGRDESRPCICAAAVAIWNHDVHNSMSRRVIGCLSWSAANQKRRNCKDLTEHDIFVLPFLLRHYSISIRISAAS